MDYPYVATLAAWVRSVEAWLIVVLFLKWFWEQFGADIDVLFRPTTSSTVSVVGKFRILAMIAILLTCVVALSGALVSAVNLVFTYVSVSLDPISTMPSGVYWMINQWFPVSLAVNALCLRVIFLHSRIPLKGAMFVKALFIAT